MPGMPLSGRLQISGMVSRGEGELTCYLGRRFQCKYHDQRGCSGGPKELAECTESATSWRRKNRIRKPATIVCFAARSQLSSPGHRRRRREMEARPPASGQAGSQGSMDEGSRGPGTWSPQVQKIRALAPQYLLLWFRCESATNPRYPVIAAWGLSPPQDQSSGSQRGPGPRRGPCPPRPLLSRPSPPALGDPSAVSCQCQSQTQCRSTRETGCLTAL